LYHGQVALKTSRDFFAVLALVPPGSEARKLALFKRALFSATKDASGLAFPEILILALKPGKLDVRGPEGSRRKALKLLEKNLSAAWAGIEGGFETDGLVETERRLFLAAKGPLEALKTAALASARAAFPGSDWEPTPSPSEDFPPPSDGFFLAAQTALSDGAILALSPPRLSFRDADLALFAFERNREPLALAWRELARSKRKGL
jgi:hypothetical protein